LNREGEERVITIQIPKSVLGRRKEIPIHTKKKVSKENHIGKTPQGRQKKLALFMKEEKGGDCSCPL